MPPVDTGRNYLWKVNAKKKSAPGLHVNLPVLRSASSQLRFLVSALHSPLLQPAWQIKVNKRQLLKYGDEPQSLWLTFYFSSDTHLELLFFVCHLDQPFLQQTLHSLNVLFLLPRTAQEARSVNIYSFMEFNSKRIFLKIILCVRGPLYTSFFFFFLKFLFIHTFSETGPMSVGREPAWVQSKADGGRER